MSQDTGREDKEVIEIDLDEYNEMREELKRLREQSEKEEPKEVVKMRFDDYKKLRDELESYRNKPTFNAPVPQNTVGITPPYYPQAQQPAKKRSIMERIPGAVGWATIGGLVMIGGSLVLKAITGSDTGSDNTFGGTMP